MDMLKLCKKCRKENEETFHGYIGWVNEDCYECPICQNTLIDTILTIDEYNIIDNVSDDVSFLEAMIKLKEENIIEFQSRMSQFKTQTEQQESVQKQKDNQIKCPTCNSTKVKRISGTAKIAGAVAFGLLSKTARSQFKCENCGYKW